MPQLLETVRCNFCSRYKPRPLVHVLTSNQAICEYCLDWHLHSMAFLDGSESPRGCQECGQSFDELCNSAGGVEVRLWVVMKDGIHQLLCKTCVAAYLPKRADLYQGTQFGSEALKL